MKKLLLLGILMVTSACTPRELRLWQEWYRQDPDAAVEFALNIEPESEPLPAIVPESGQSIWDKLADCESGGNWAINTGNGYYGGLQFGLTAWRAVGMTGYPHQHSREEQIAAGERLKEMQGWGAWPGCSRKLGLR